MKRLELTVLEFRQLVTKMKSYEEALGVLYWDMRTGAPRKGLEGRSNVIGELSAELFKLSVSDTMGALLDRLSDEEVIAKLDPVNRKMVVDSKKDYDLNRRIPPDRYKAYVVLTSQAESVWEEAKEAADFAMFQPYLQQVVDFKREFIDLWGYGDNKYDTLLDQYEPDMTVAQLDVMFAQLREKLVPIVSAIHESSHRPDTSFLYQPFEKQKQREFSEFILQQMGFDFAAGRLDESVHPFAIGLNPGDVRITTRFLADDIGYSLFSSLHEGGHALYEQNISTDLLGTTLCTGTSMGIHESQSRFWENIIGRSRAFWEHYFSHLRHKFPAQFDGITPEAFYLAINEAKPSLIRTESDELTYNLHVMIRYEIEKDLINDRVNVHDLPEIWNEKYREYLGVVPANDAEGVLQDVHWSGGGFGYFPSYSLGNMYAAQMAHAIRERMPGFDDHIAAGRLLPIKQWLTERVYAHGKLLTPKEIVQQVTGEPLNSAYLVQYIEQKYNDIYQL